MLVIPPPDPSPPNSDEIDTDDLDKLKDKYSVPRDKRSCHTAVLGKNVFEGHVPAKSIKKFLKSNKKDIGLVVPDMPMGSPGMEYDNHKEDYVVYSFDKKGDAKVFESIKH